MKKLAFTLLAIATMAVTLPAMAEVKIGVISVQEIVSQSKMAQKADADLRKKGEAFQEEFSKKEKPLVERRNSLVEKRSVMDEEKFKKAEEELLADIRAFQTEMGKKKQELDKSVAEKRSSVFNAIQGVIDEYAKANGYDLVLRDTSAVYATDAEIITAPIIAEVNKKLK